MAQHEQKKNSSIFHHYYWLHYIPEKKEEGESFACITDCSYIVTSLVPSTLQFRVEDRL